LPRFNAILVAVSRARLPDVLKEIRRLDQPNAPHAAFQAFKLHKASAQQLQTLLQTYFYNRYKQDETTQQNQTYFFPDTTSNTLFVQAGPADMKEISDLIEQLDTFEPEPRNFLKIIPLKYAIASELATIIQPAITQGAAAA